MKNKVKWPRTLIAIGFISMILISNLWLHNYLFGGDLPEWAHIMFEISFVGIFVGSIAETYYWMRKQLGLDDDDRQ